MFLRPTLILSHPTVTLCLLPLFFIVLTLVIATLLSSMDQGNTLTLIVESCKGNIRYSSIAFAYNLSSAIFGGLSPIIVMTLIDKVNLIRFSL